MAEQFSRTFSADRDSCFKEAVCIDTARVFDSCADRNCLEDLNVYFTDINQSVVDSATTVKCRKCEIIDCIIDVEDVPFNKGYYTIDITFFFKCSFDAYTTTLVPPEPIDGLAVFTKKCILYGGEGSVKVFSSEFAADELDEQRSMGDTNPRAIVQAADPLVLDCSLCQERTICCPPCPCVPKKVCRCFNGTFTCDRGKSVIVTLGLFTIVQLERNVQLLIPAYDYCVPCRECTATSDNPCDAFSRLDFPVNEFFPADIQDSCCDEEKNL